MLDRLEGGFGIDEKVAPMITERGGCSHIEAVETVRPPVARVCEECVKMGSRWVHLRTCQSCGGTRCCDSSPNRHASKHARSSGHPVIASAEEGERWLYCYPDDSFAEYEKTHDRRQSARPRRAMDEPGLHAFTT